MARFSVLIVDDEKNIRHTLRVCLETMETRSSRRARRRQRWTRWARSAFDLVFLDLRLGRQSGLDLIPQLLAENPNVVIVVVTAYATIETAVEAIRRGAWDYLPKPFTPAQIGHLVEKAKAQRAPSARLVDLEDRLQSEAPEIDLGIGARRRCARCWRSSTAPRRRTCRCCSAGESGTGKGVLARAMHLESKRRDRPFVDHQLPDADRGAAGERAVRPRKGAFTGAVRDQPGRVEAAEGGTLFLDEIGELPAGLQAKLLRFLQEHAVRAARARRARARRTSASSRRRTATWRTTSKTGRFREDLFFRLNVIEVSVPTAARAPRGHHPARAPLPGVLRAGGGAHAAVSFSPAAEAALASYEWPGNVRELRNAIERAVILWPSSMIEPQAFPERIAESAGRGPVLAVGGDVSVEELERAHISAVVARCRTMEEAAEILGIDVSTLWRKRKRYEGGDG